MTQSFISVKLHIQTIIRRNTMEKSIILIIILFGYQNM